jgi:bifunctional UDP-N-acetylglucosamine pyrophosphorylase/glucosamine-1-phosphate N-acetyltransferase
MTFRTVILAAGKGTRMGSDKPKVLLPIGGKPIIQHLIESIKESKVDGIPVVVIGHEREKLCESFGETCEYAVQEEQLGTGHAVMCAREAVGNAEAVIVLYGDHPFISPEVLRRLVDIHEAQRPVITMMTTVVPTFDDWHSVFQHWGRILRDAHDHIIGIREYKDAMESEREIRELNPGLFCFDAKWLWENVPQLKNFNAIGEYYLTDLVGLAVAQGHEIAGAEIRPEESIGVNTPEEFRVAEEIYAGNLV